MLSFVSGSGPFSNQTFEVSLTDDNVVENDENISFQAIASEGTFSPGGGNNGTAQITVLDDDGKGVTKNYYIHIRSCSRQLANLTSKYSTVIPIKAPKLMCTHY